MRLFSIVHFHLYDFCLRKCTLESKFLLLKKIWRCFGAFCLSLQHSPLDQISRVWRGVYLEISTQIIFASLSMMHLILSLFLLCPWIVNSCFIADYAYKAIDALPVSAHPMTQFTTGVMALQVEWQIFFLELLIYAFIFLEWIFLP